MNLGPKQLGKKRWLAWTLLAIGLLASLAANVHQGHPSIPGWLVAGWPPFALLGALEVMTRVLVVLPLDTKPQRWLTGGLWVVTGIIAAGAAWVSYWHIHAVAVLYGDSGLSAHILPVTVDGMVVVATGGLVALNLATRARTEQASTSTSMDLEQEHAQSTVEQASAGQVTPALTPVPALNPAARKRTDDELLPELQRLLGQGGYVPVQKVADELKVGTARARRLLDQINERAGVLAEA